jgi:hyperosmotically inducible protein
MKIQSAYSLALVSAASLFLTSAPMRAAATETDDRIESAAKKSHVFKTYLKDDSIETDSVNGVVTLTGMVDAPYHKTLAEDTVAGLPGVTKVDNQIKISGEQIDPLSDAWISMQVRSALMFHRNVSVTATTINVKDGVVTLTGEATSQAQRELTSEYAQDIEHVKSVENNMVVVDTAVKSEATLGEKIDDASITAQVKASLFVHRSTSAIHTVVSTTDGVVTLGGIAKNEAEKSLITKLVIDIDGVVFVNNNMSIAAVIAVQ